MPPAYPDTGQTDVPPVGWNGVNVIGGSTLSYCQTRTRCSVTCTATSIFSPMFSVNNGDCYPVTTLSKQFTFTRNHPNFLITFNCPFVKSFRCVYNVSSYSPKYILEESTGKLFSFLHSTFLIIVRKYKCGSVLFSSFDLINTNINASIDLQYHLVCSLLAVTSLILNVLQLVFVEPRYTHHVHCSYISLLFTVDNCGETPPTPTGM